MATRRTILVALPVPAVAMTRIVTFILTVYLADSLVRWAAARTGG
jgi:hypothetical protein